MLNLKPTPVNIIVKSLSAGSVITNSNLQFNTIGVNVQTVIKNISNAVPPVLLGSILSVSADGMYLYVY
jgi:hypothetical protein